jgi:guanylate kinase
MNERPITGHLVLIMAPSGSGKSLLVDHLRQTIPSLYFAVSCTTRPPRPHEKEGETYYFVSKETFEEKIKKEAFVEWAEFSGNRYGTLVSEILAPIQAGKVVVREVELQGILAIREIIPKENRTVMYIEAGSWDILERRILARAPMSPEHLAARKLRWAEESKWKAFADIIITNKEGHLEEAKQELQACIERIVLRVASR